MTGARPYAHVNWSLVHRDRPNKDDEKEEHIRAKLIKNYLMEQAKFMYVSTYGNENHKARVNRICWDSSMFLSDENALPH